MKRMVNNTEGRKKYIIEEESLMGICLKPDDIKGLKGNNVDISRAWCTIKDGEIFIINMRIKGSSVKGEDGKLISPERKLLEKKSELERIIKRVFRERLVLVPLELSTNEDGKLKVLVGIGRKNPDYVAPVKPVKNNRQAGYNGKQHGYNKRPNR